MRALYVVKHGFPFSHSPADDALNWTMQVDETLGWKTAAFFHLERTAKDYAGRSYLVNYRSGTFGFREFGDPASEKLKIFVVGDSFTNADNVSNDEAYYAVLRNRLSSDMPIELFVYGANGYGTLQELMIIKQYVQIIRPDVLVLQLCDNDFINNSYELERPDYSNSNSMRRPYLMPGGDVIYKIPQSSIRIVLNDAARYSRFLWWILTRLDGRLAQNKETMGFAEFQQSVRITNELLAKIRRELPDATIAYGVAVTPVLGKTEPYRTIWSQLMASNGFRFVGDIATAVEQAEAAGLVVRAEDGGHWSPRGHEIAGDVLAARLLSDRTDIDQASRKVRNGYSSAESSPGVAPR